MSSMKFTSGETLSLKDMPIPTEWVLEGNPVAKGHVMVQSDDQKQSGGIWECTAGRFHFIFPWHETIRILEGEVTIEEEGGVTYTLRPGDFAHFPLGLKTTWHVPNYVRKVFFLVTPEPLSLFSSMGVRTE